MRVDPQALLNEWKDKHVVPSFRYSWSAQDSRRPVLVLEHKKQAVVIEVTGEEANVEGLVEDGTSISDA